MVVPPHRDDDAHLFLKRCNNLSNEQMEYQLLDRMSYQRFCGLTDSASILDRTTVWTFENRIGEVGAQALLMVWSNNCSSKAYKLSVNVDRRYKVIRKIETDTASTHDSQYLDAVLDSANTCREVRAIRVLHGEHS